MRHTELAKAELNAAKATLLATNPADPLNVHHLHVARALVELSTAIADIFDKLQVIDRKLSGPSAVPSGPPTRATMQSR
jgi:hypothetical protein